MDSQGAFTVDFARAADLLRAHQFERPYFYLLKLVQAAIAGGAAEIDLEVHPTRVSLSAVGNLRLSEQEAQDVLRGPLSCHRSAWVSHLAWALAGLAALPQGSAVCSVGDRRFEIASGTIQLAPELGGNHLTLELTTSTGLKELLMGNPHLPELKRSLAFSPINITLNGELLRPASDFPHRHWDHHRLSIDTGLFFRHLLQADHCAGHRLVLRRPAGVAARVPGDTYLTPMLVDLGTTRWVSRATPMEGSPMQDFPVVYSWSPAPEGAFVSKVAPESPECLLVATGSREWLQVPRGQLGRYQLGEDLRTWAQLWFPMEQGGRARLYPCQHGVLLEPLEVDLVVPGTVAVVEASGLPTDLSQGRLVEGPELEALLTEVRSEAQTFARDLAEMHELDGLERSFKKSIQFLKARMAQVST